MKLLIIDDHQIVREGISNLAKREGLDVVGEASNKEEAIALIAATSPDVITVDLSLPDGSGLEIVKFARKNDQKMGIVVISILDDDSNLIACMNAGASGFVSKTSTLDDILAAIQSAVRSPLSFTSKGLVRAVNSKVYTGTLTSRELEIIAKLPSGLSGEELAKELFITESTLKTHLSSIYRKLQVRNRTGAVSEAKRRGLIVA
ncbi:MAG: response regulator transcription factor [Actinomycetales bacterium]|nr:response regulator transcription factor [Actinomycetales bacterium]